MDFLHILGHTLTHALTDTLRALPFLFLAYLLLEWIAHRSPGRLERILGSDRFGPIGGALLGCVPQCGFSVTAANLYAGRVITLGTLLAVFLSTSDEAIPVILASPDHIGTLLPLIGCKLVIAITAGLVIDRLCKSRAKPSPAAEAPLYHAHHGHSILSGAVRHTVQVFVFLLIASFLLGLVIEFVGEDNLGRILLTGSIFQPFLAGLIGLIPSCAASVVLTEFYLSGAIQFGSVIAGLSTGAGAGLLVLLRVNHNPRENCKIILLLYLIGSGAGLLINLVGLG